MSGDNKYYREKKAGKENGKGGLTFKIKFRNSLLRRWHFSKHMKEERQQTTWTSKLE